MSLAAGYAGAITFPGIYGREGNIECPLSLIGNFRWSRAVLRRRGRPIRVIHSANGSILRDTRH